MPIFKESRPGFWFLAQIQIQPIITHITTAGILRGGLFAAPLRCKINRRLLFRLRSKSETVYRITGAFNYENRTSSARPVAVVGYATGSIWLEKDNTNSTNVENIYF